MPVDRQWQLPRTEYAQPKVSAVITTRNEHPVLFVSIFAILEELEFWGYPFEFVIVSNCDTDLTPEILEHRFRHWIKTGQMQIVRFDEKASIDVARNRGAAVATGDVLLFSDAHVSYKIGTLHGMIQGWLKHGGMWHSRYQSWGAPLTGDLMYGSELTLEKNFWGRQSFYLPAWAKEGGRIFPYTVPMGAFATLVIGRTEFWSVRGFHEGFRCYAGGESYLSLKWWLLGKQIWLQPEGIMRHDNKGTRVQRSADGKLDFRRNYGWTNEDVWFNHMLSAYTIGGEPWLDLLYQKYRDECKHMAAWLANVEKLHATVLEIGQEDRAWIAERQQMSLDELLMQAPWNLHETTA
jgi:glycosyltransferase involved in cell wall biosynthesis